jgi:uncharacterized Tic20 family protein
MADSFEISPLTADETTMAALAHVLQAATWWIGPLVIFLTRRESRFVSFHALQALLWQIAYTLLFMGGMVVYFLAIILAVLPRAGHPQPGPPPLALFIVMAMFWLAMIIMMGLNLTLAVVYGIKAGRGQWASYPLIGRLARRFLGRGQPVQPSQPLPAIGPPGAQG